MRKLGFFAAFIVPAFLVLGYYLGGWWNMLTLGFVFVLEPLLDTLMGLDGSNTSLEEQKQTSKDPYYQFVLYVWTFVQFITLFWACYIVVYGNLSTWYEWIGFVIGTSLVTGGIGITVAHELGHKSQKLDQRFSQLLLMTVGYMHFFIEHNRGHHIKVATPADPATSRKGESFYSFWVRSVFKGYLSAWSLEKKRLIKKKLKIISIHNQMIWFSLLPFLFWISITLFFSILTQKIAFNVSLFLVTQAVIGFSLLELVNYIEHYGIQRRLKENGKYERVNPLHSWNANHKLSNFFLFQLQRHSDHHAYASKPYQVLNHYDESPQLPAGYPTMIIIALVPPIWYRLMNQRLENWVKKQGKEPF